MTADEVTAIAIDAIAPELGASMARASVLGIAARLGLRGALTADEVRRLLEALSPGLAVFVGREHAQVLLDAVRARLTDGGAL